MVHAYFRCERIATHKVYKGHGHYVTNTDHYSAKKESRLIGPNTETLINRLLKESRYPLKVLRKIQGILRLKDTFSNEELDYACEMAL